MAIKPKKNKVTGTKNKDKITWTNSKAWKKALTVKAGAGNDTINFKKSSYNNKLYGETGNDSIYGGIGNDKIWGGKGSDYIDAGKGNNFIYFAKNDGKDTIVNGKGSDTLVFTNEKINKIKAKYSGNNVVLTYTGGKIVLKNYMKGHSVSKFQVGKTTKTINSILPYNKVKRSGRYYTGTNKKDYVSSDTYEAIVNTYDGDDKIELLDDCNTVTAGKGNDIIISNKGGHIFNFTSGDGSDTVKESTPYNLYNFTNEKDISGLKFSKTSSGYNISYNGGKDSVNVTLDKNNRLYEAWQQGTVKDYAKVNGKYYEISSQGFWGIYSSQFYHPLLGDIDTSNVKNGVLTASDINDKIDCENANTIKALGGNDVIERSYSTSSANVYGGKGNDTISANYDDRLFFNTGDGKDLVYGTSINYVFLDETDLSDLEISQSTKGDLSIKYNNGNDSITVKPSQWDENYDEDINTINYGHIQIRENSQKYGILNSDTSCKGIVGTSGKDEFDMESYYNISEIYGMGGEDEFNLGRFCDETPNVYINISNEGKLLDNALHISDFAIMDYFKHEQDYTIKAEVYENETYSTKYLDTSTLTTELKNEIASWLSNNGVAEYESVAKAFEANNTTVVTGLVEKFNNITWNNYSA